MSFIHEFLCLSVHHRWICVEYLFPTSFTCLRHGIRWGVCKFVDLRFGLYFIFEAVTYWNTPGLNQFGWAVLVINLFYRVANFDPTKGNLLFLLSLFLRFRFGIDFLRWKILLQHWFDNFSMWKWLIKLQQATMMVLQLFYTHSNHS